MKTKLAVGLSLIGVLGAGSAAALVNTQILDSGPTQSGASAAVLPPATTVDVTVPDVTIGTLPVATTIVAMPASSPAGDTATSTTAPTTTVAPAPAPSGFLTAFNVGDAGVVTVDVIDGRLVLVSAEPKAGWSVAKAEESSTENEVEVYFTSTTVRVEFEAAFVDGQIVPRVESKSIGGTTATATSNTVPSDTIGGHDDHDDDDHDDDRDDDDRDDDDHDDDRDDDDHDDDHDDDRDDD